MASHLVRAWGAYDGLQMCAYVILKSTHKHGHTHIPVPLHEHAYIPIHEHTLMHARIHTCTHAHTYTHTHTHSEPLTHTHPRTHKYIPSGAKPKNISRKYRIKVNGNDQLYLPISTGTHVPTLNRTELRHSSSKAKPVQEESGSYFRRPIENVSNTRLASLCVCQHC